MISLIIALLLIGVLSVAFMILLVLGIAKRNRILVYISATIFILMLAGGIWVIVTLASKSIRKASQIAAPRSGMEIYTALFGQPDNTCLEVLEAQDQVIPKIDVAIWLHMRTCPDELNRILRQKGYHSSLTSTDGWEPSGTSENENWFKPERMGDSIWIFTHKVDSFGNGQTLYVSRDSSEAYCKDVWD